MKEWVRDLYAVIAQGGWVMGPIYLTGLVAWILICNRIWYYMQYHPSQDLSLEQKLKAHLSLSRYLSTIASLAAIAPLWGLLGTVSGMVHSFETITEYGYGNPAFLSAGISESLVSTQAGLVVAFPVMIAVHILRRRCKKLDEYYDA